MKILWIISFFVLVAYVQGAATTAKPAAAQAVTKKLAAPATKSAAKPPVAPKPAASAKPAPNTTKPAPTTAKPAPTKAKPPLTTAKPAAKPVFGALATAAPAKA